MDWTMAHYVFRRTPCRITNPAERIWSRLRRVAEFGYAPARIFDDWLEMILSAHLSVTDNLSRKGTSITTRDGPHEIRYAGLMAAYPEPRSQAAFEAAYERLVAWVDLCQVDALGGLYEFVCPEEAKKSAQAASRSRPWRVAVRPDGTPLRFLQFQCYAGKRLIELGRRHPRAELHAFEADETCAKMCAVNLILFGLTGVVQHSVMAGGVPKSRQWRILRGFVGRSDPQPSGLCPLLSPLTTVLRAEIRQR
jgi:hypothetical protein